MAGQQPMPRAVYLKVVDLVIELTRDAKAAPVSASLSCGGDVRRIGRRIKGGERDAR